MNFNTPPGAVIFLLTSLLLPTADYTNAELCSDDSNATSMCRVDADCIRKFHCRLHCSNFNMYNNSKKNLPDLIETEIHRSLNAIVTLHKLPKGNCADGTPSPAKCSEMKNCPPNHACHRGQCCSLFTNKRKTSLCPDGTPTSIRCNEKNRCDTGAECVHGFCCSKVHAAPAKQGRCPILLVNLRTRSTVQPEDQCYSDVHCESVRKCCLTVAGKRCLLPETDFGRCADGSPAESVCNREEQCGKKSQSCVRGLCCNTAAHANTKTKNPTDTESSCPRSVHPRQIQFASRCSMDTDCHFQKKCCPTYIGRRCLILPVTKAGSCPKIKVSGERKRRQHRCYNDGHCPGEMKCCNLPLGKACLFPS
ncbi:WAP four-disulfide core domain protein 8 [Trichinella papuae]|uniref:WAP four-disulfide core domain protein 8 n=1 Tax=Trichinella papuae TaxID=268474 RepID=A0A0V1MNC7_9BILA|nr:WAP four-disulfide core domain protein 8 [Trichinella papuae]